MAKIDTKVRHITTEDIFSDLGFAPAEASLGRAKTLLHIEIIKAIEEEGYTARQLEGVLDIPQPRVSELLTGKISKMTTDRLMKYLGKLGRQLEITTKRAPVVEGGRDLKCND